MGSHGGFRISSPKSPANPPGFSWSNIRDPTSVATNLGVQFIEFLTPKRSVCWVGQWVYSKTLWQFFLQKIGTNRSSLTSWWFQPLWKILVKMGHLPQIGVKINIFEITTQSSLICSTNFSSIELPQICSKDPIGDIMKWCHHISCESVELHHPEFLGKRLGCHCPSERLSVLGANYATEP